jgi:hypothetical protein
MTTMEKLSGYKMALERYSRMKKAFEAEEKNGKRHRKPFTETEPLPSQFEIGTEHLEWAEKIRRSVITVNPPTLDEKLKPKIKLPVRRTI